MITKGSHALKKRKKESGGSEAYGWFFLFVYSFNLNGPDQKLTEPTK